MEFINNLKTNVNINVNSLEKFITAIQDENNKLKTELSEKNVYITKLNDEMKNLNEVSELIDNIIVQTYIRLNNNNHNYYKIGHPDVLDDIRPIKLCDWDIDENNKIQVEEEVDSDDGDINIDLERIKKYAEIAKPDVELGKMP